MKCKTAFSPNYVSSNPVTIDFKGLDCSTLFFVISSNIDSHTISYQSGVSAKTSLGDWSNQFSNNDITNCPIDTCILENAPAGVTIGTSSPWKIEASNN